MEQKHQTHFQTLRHLLKLEAEAEKQQLLARLKRDTAEKAEKTGISLLNLIIDDELPAVGGLIILVLRKRGTAELPWHNLGHGRPVLLSAETDEKGEPPSWRGTISRTNRKQIKVAVPRWAETGERTGSFRLDLSYDEISQRRQREALERAELATNNRLSNLRDVLLGQTEPRFSSSPAPLNLLNPTLNRSQQDAVQNALAAEDVAIIHGPPGTGKTTAVVELIRQAVARKENVLACSPSHTAVDNILVRLVAQGVNVVRIGNPIRVDESLWPYTLDSRAADHPNFKLAAKYNKQARELFHKVDRYTRSKPAPGEKRGYRQEAKALLAEAKALEQRAVDQILDQADVVCGTLTGLSYRTLRRSPIRTWGVIDEAGQADEPSAWIPLRRCQRVVLAGDHCQLAPHRHFTQSTKRRAGGQHDGAAHTALSLATKSAVSSPPNTA